MKATSRCRPSLNRPARTSAPAVAASTSEVRSATATRIEAFIALCRTAFRAFRPPVARSLTLFQPAMSAAGGGETGPKLERTPAGGAGRQATIRRRAEPQQSRRCSVDR